MESSASGADHTPQRTHERRGDACAGRLAHPLRKGEAEATDMFSKLYLFAVGAGVALVFYASHALQRALP